MCEKKPQHISFFQAVQKDAPAPTTHLFRRSCGWTNNSSGCHGRRPRHQLLRTPSRPRLHRCPIQYITAFLKLICNFPPISNPIPAWWRPNTILDASSVVPINPPKGSDCGVVCCDSSIKQSRTYRVYGCMICSRGSFCVGRCSTNISSVSRR